MVSLNVFSNAHWNHELPGCGAAIRGERGEISVAALGNGGGISASLMCAPSVSPATTFFF
jgi:hypothetical protein